MIRFIETWNLWQGRWLVWWAWSLAVIEVIDVALRSRGIQVELVSQTMRRLVFEGLTGLAFFFGAMTVHWFVTWHRATWEGTTATVLGLVFWAVFLAYVVVSYADPTPRHWPVLTQWIRYPPIAAGVGGLLAWVCFPQGSIWLPGGAR